MFRYRQRFDSDNDSDNVLIRITFQFGQRVDLGILGILGILDNVSILATFQFGQRFDSGHVLIRARYFGYFGYFRYSGQKQWAMGNGQWLD